MNDPEEPTEPKEPVDDAIASRSQRKREALDLQKMGERLVNLDTGDLATVPVPAELADAIALWRRIRSQGLQLSWPEFLPAS